MQVNKQLSTLLRVDGKRKVIMTERNHLKMKRRKEKMGMHRRMKITRRKEGREKDNNGKEREVKRRKYDVDGDEDDEEEEKMNDFEKYLLQKDHDPSSKVNSSNLLKKMKKSQCHQEALKSKMQKLMCETIEDSAKGTKDAKQDLPVEDILAEDNKAEDIKEDVEEDLREDDFDESPHVYELEDNSECHEEKDKQNEPENEEENVHGTEKGASLSEVMDNTEKLEKYKVKKTERFDDGTIVNIVKKGYILEKKPQINLLNQ